MTALRRKGYGLLDSGNGNPLSCTGIGIGGNGMGSVRLTKNFQKLCFFIFRGISQKLFQFGNFLIIHIGFFNIIVADEKPLLSVSG